VPAATGRIDPLLLERCFALYQEHHYDELVSTGEEALAYLRDTPRSTSEAHAAAALWSVVGLAKQGLDDTAGAALALESALRIAPAEERMTYAQHIADLALSAAQTALSRAGNHDADNRVALLRSALAWTERGLSAVPSDARLRGRSQTARAELWPAYEQSVHRLLRRQEFGEARRLLREALEDPEIPPARVAPFEELLSATFAGEIGALTARAIRNMQGARESEALTALHRAEELLSTMPDEALPKKRREELDQRLLWGYTQLGVRRVEAGDHEAALDPLVRARPTTPGATTR
jgi:tetratricopeptide (TPR) repeat protein